MTTTEIIAEANEEGMIIGSADINLEIRLRRKIIPEFYNDVGECAWRRISGATLSVIANTRDYSLPTDFGKMLSDPITIAADGTKRGLVYIGEDPVALNLASADTVPGSPGGYWFIRVVGSPTELRAIRLDKIPNQSVTFYYTYLSYLRFADLVTSVELDNYIPFQFQWALVNALKKEIYAGRIPVGDNRWTIAQDEYQKTVMDAQDYREPASRVGMKRVRNCP